MNNFAGEISMTHISRRRMIGTMGGGAAAALAIGTRAFAQGQDAPMAPPTTVSNPPRIFGPDAPPTTYFTDPDIISVDPSFDAYVVPNSAITRLWTGALWMEGPAWSNVGRFLVWSDIPNNRQMRWSE